MYVFLVFIIVCENGSTRLINGFTELDGRVEICFDNQWVGVCPDDDWGIKDMIVVCRNNGYIGE